MERLYKYEGRDDDSHRRRGKKSKKGQFVSRGAVVRNKAVSGARLSARPEVTKSSSGRPRYRMGKHQ